MIITSVYDNWVTKLFFTWGIVPAVFGQLQLYPGRILRCSQHFVGVALIEAIALHHAQCVL